MYPDTAVVINNGLYLLIILSAEISKAVCLLVLKVEVQRMGRRKNVEKMREREKEKER